MQVSHTNRAVSASFDDQSLESVVGLVPAIALAVKARLRAVADQWLKLSCYFSTNAGAKVTALVAGMLSGADSIDDMVILRHGGLGKLFSGCYSPSRLGSVPRTFTFCHVPQLDAVASRGLRNLATIIPIVAGMDELALVDIDDTIKEVDGHQKQGAGHHPRWGNVLRPGDPITSAPRMPLESRVDSTVPSFSRTATKLAIPTDQPSRRWRKQHVHHQGQQGPRFCRAHQRSPGQPADKTKSHQNISGFRICTCNVSDAKGVRRDEDGDGDKGVGNDDIETGVVGDDGSMTDGIDIVNVGMTRTFANSTLASANEQRTSSCVYKTYPRRWRPNNRPFAAYARVRSGV